MSGRQDEHREGHWACQLVELPHDIARSGWYVWDLRSTDPWWLPEGIMHDAPGMDAELALWGFIASFLAAEDVIWA